MSQYIKPILFISVMLVFFTGCEYDLSGEYNQDIAKPVASHQGDITLSLREDSIIIYEATQINYSINSFGLKCNAIEISYLDTKLSNDFSDSGSFKITPDFSTTGWFNLKARFYLGTGSGSIADKLKAENYIGEKTWKIKFVKFSDLKVELKQHLNKDSLLELYWVKPKHLPITKISLNDLALTRTNGDTAFYALENYCGGSENYWLSVELGGSRYLHSELAIDYPLPELHVEQVGVDSCRLYWKSDIRLNYMVNTMAIRDSLFTKKTYASQTFKLPYLGYDIQFDVYFMPYAVTEPRKAVIRREIIKFSLGISVPYSSTYCLGKDKLFFFDGDTYSNYYKTSSFPLPTDYTNKGAVGGYPYCNNSGSLIVLGYMGNFTMFRNGNLSPETLITGADRLVRVKNVQLVDNNCIGLSYTNLVLPTYKLINLGSDLTWNEFSFTPDVIYPTTSNYLSGLALTQSGKYLCSIGATDFIIYDLSDHKTAQKVFTAPKDFYLSVINNPTQPNQVIVMTKTGFELRNCPGFELAGSFVDPENSGVIPVNVDPYSNVLLGWSPLRYHFYNLSTMKEIFRLGAPWGEGEYTNLAKLSRNYLFNQGRAMDLTKYLK